MTLVLLLLLLLPTTSPAPYKVGLLLDALDTYKSSTLSIAEYAADDTSSRIQIVTEEFNKTMRSIIDACCRLVEKGVVVVISDSSSTQTAIQADILTPMKIPLISAGATDPFLPSVKRNFLLRMSPSDTYQSRAIFDIIKFYEWEKISILASSDSYGLHGLLELQRLMAQEIGYSVKNVFFFRNLSGAIEALHGLKSALARIIVLNCVASRGKEVLEAARDIGLLSKGVVWIVTDAIAASPEFEHASDGVSVSPWDGLLGVRPAIDRGPAYDIFEKIYLQLDRNLDELTTYRLMTFETVAFVDSTLAGLEKKYSQVTSCSMPGGWKDGKAMLSALRNTDYTGITGRTNFTKAGQRGRVSYDVVNFAGGTFQRVGVWHNSSGLAMAGSVKFIGGGKSVPPASASNLIGQHLRLGILPEGPFSYLKADCEGNACWSGLCPDMVTRMADDLGFTYEYVVPDDGKWGGFNVTSGAWNGLIAEILSETIDIVTLPLSTSTARKEVIEFSYPFMDSGLLAVTRGDSRIDTNFFFLSPFKGEVWMAVIATTFLITFLIWILSKLSPYGKRGGKVFAMQTCTCEGCINRRREMVERKCTFRNTKKFECMIVRAEEEDRGEDLSFFNSIWLIGAGLVAQSGESLPYCLSGRFLLLSWWFFMLLVITIYTSALTAFLTVTNLGIPLNSVIDLLGQDQFEWGLIGSRHPETLLLSHKNERYSEIVEEGVTLDDLDTALRRLREGNFVFIDESVVLAHQLHGDCNVYSIGSEFQSFEYAFGMKKDSPFTSLIDFSILRYREEGLLDTLWEKWSDKGTHCAPKSVDSNRLGIDKLGGMFYILAYGVGLSFGLILLECVYASVMDVKRGEAGGLGSAVGRRLALKLNHLINQGRVARKMKSAPTSSTNSS